jgi:iron(III) transport system ATP-binding protein
MSAFDNVAYPLRARKVRKSEIAGRVDHVLGLVGIPELSKQYPGQMSGGQQQRVALARAIVSNDELVLFDEPLSNVDAKVREQLRLELLSMQRRLGFSALYVTHDQTEAMELAHRIAVMRLGKVMQLGRPREVYECPNSRYVANFVGTTNELPGSICGAPRGDHVTVKTAVGHIVAVPAKPSFREGDDAVVVFRPERCAISLREPEGDAGWRGVVEAALFLGPHTEHVVRVAGNAFRVWRADVELMEPGTNVWISVPPQHLRVVPANDDDADLGAAQPGQEPLGA